MPRVHDPEFDTAFVSIFPRAVALAEKIVGDRTTAEDVAAEALARAFARWTTLKDLSYREGWVLRVTTNLAIDVVRRGRLRLDRSAAIDPQEMATLRVALGTALRSLPRRQREIVALRHLAGLSEPEVAELIGVSLGTVKTHMRRGLAALRTRLGADEEGATIETQAP